MPRTNSGSNGRSGDVLSTKEAAGICKVALSTIVYWFDKGLIQGYRTPGGHRRIFRRDLEKFMKEHAIPLGQRLERDQLRVLLVGASASVFVPAEQALSGLNGQVEWTTAKSGFQAGRLVSTFKPDLMIVDVSADEVDTSQLCRELKGDAETQGIDVIVVGASQSPTEIAGLRDAGALEVLSGPLSSTQVQDLVAPRLI